MIFLCSTCVSSWCCFSIVVVLRCDFLQFRKNEKSEVYEIFSLLLSCGSKYNHTLIQFYAKLKKWDPFLVWTIDLKNPAERRNDCAENTRYSFRLQSHCRKPLILAMFALGRLKVTRMIYLKNRAYFEVRAHIFFRIMLGTKNEFFL